MRQTKGGQAMAMTTTTTTTAHTIGLDSQSLPRPPTSSGNVSGVYLIIWPHTSLDSEYQGNSPDTSA